MIIWDDGHESLYLYEDLRRSCPCASCSELKKKGVRSTVSFKKTIPLEDKSTSIKPLDIENIGRYAIRFKWNDRHDTGIYTFDFLRRLCSCEECKSGI